MSKSIINIIKAKRDKYRSLYHRNPDVITIPAGSAVSLLLEVMDSCGNFDRAYDELILKGESACAEHINKGMRYAGIPVKVELL